MTRPPHDDDPLELLRAPDLAPPPAGGHTHGDILRRVSRRRTRSAATLGAAVLSTLAVIVGVPLLVVVPEDGPATVATQPPAVVSPAPTAGDVPAGFQPRALIFASAQVGYALGEAPCDVAPCTSVAVTSDGGASWQAARTAPGTGDVAGRGGVDEIRYTDDGSDAFAFGGELWSRHGGEFAQVRLPAAESAVGLEITDGHAVAALAECDGVACRQTRLTTSPVGTDDVTALPGASTLPGRASIAVAGATVWAVSALQGATTLVRGPADGAAEMVGLEAPCAAGTDTVGITASTTSVVITCGRSGAEGTAIHASDDGGESWRQTAQDAAVQPEPLTLLASGTLLLAGPDGSLQRSTDLGRSATVVLAESYLGEVRPAGPSGAVALPPGAPDGGFLRSADDGATWQELAVR